MRTILILALLYLGFKLVARLFMPYIAKTVVKSGEKKFGHTNYNYKKPNTKGKEGETVIDQMPKQSKSSPSSNVGEYVDFEEIE